MSIVAILYKTYVGYGEYSLYLKLATGLLLTLGVFAPLVNFSIRSYDLPGELIYIPKALYFLFGFVFLLFIITIARDILWFIIDIICRVPVSDMKNPQLLQKINLITLILCGAICMYAVYAAEKMPQVRTYDIVSSKVKEKTKIVMLSDLHIDKDVSSTYLQRLVHQINNLNPDAIVLVGDLIDNTPAKLYKQMQELQRLHAKEGVYVVLGNHEFYAGALNWGLKFAQMGFTFLNNYGVRLKDKGVFIGGIPDINSVKGTRMKVNINNALYQAQKSDYVILLSHTPKLVPEATQERVDLQLSGHTHGGQIFPFHYVAKQANDGHLAGFYEVNGIKLYVSRGAGYWGPPLRILAPSEIVVFNLIPEKNGK